MDKENGKGSEGSSGSSKLSNPADPAALLDAASLFGGKFSKFQCLIIQFGLIVCFLIVVYSLLATRRCKHGKSFRGGGGRRVRFGPAWRHAVFDVAPDIGTRRCARLSPGVGGVQCRGRLQQRLHEYALGGRQPGSQFRHTCCK